MINGQKRKQILILFICAAVMLLGWRIRLRMQETLFNLDENIAVLEHERTEAQEGYDRNKKYLKMWEAVSGFQDEMVEKRDTQFTEYLQRLEMDRDFFFASLGSPTGKPFESNEDFQQLSYDLNFDCDLEDLVEFLDDLDRSTQLLRIGRLHITKKNPGFGFARFLTDLSVEMTVSIPAAQQAPETDFREDQP
ncbi:MAG: hypothetical protein IID32_06200 [Planctomycetes bacterium]|nr:hypothetical protein [Planctomycetota bacterium]